MLSEFENIYFRCKVWFSLLDVSFTTHTQNLVYKTSLKKHLGYLEENFFFCMEIEILKTKAHIFSYFFKKYHIL